jgi:hypothetical protein
MNRFLLFAFTSLLCAVSAHAQYELKAGNFNSLFQANLGKNQNPVVKVIVPIGNNEGTLPQTLASNFRGVGSVSGASGSVQITPPIVGWSFGNNTTSVFFSNTSSLRPGMIVTGTGINTEARIVSISGPNYYVLSTVLSVGWNVLSYGPNLKLSSTNIGTAVTVPSTAGLRVGMIVTGPGITTGARIVSITNTTTYVLSTAPTPNATNKLLTYTPAPGFPSNTATDPNKSIVMTRSTIGGIFASGVPRYFLGDEITPPLVKANGVTPLTKDESLAYWRSKPVQPGDELITPFVTSGLIMVKSSSTTSATVTLTSLPTAPSPLLVVGSTLLGGKVKTITAGTLTVVLDKNADRTITANTQVSYGSPATYNPPFPAASVNVTDSNISTTSGTLVTFTGTIPAQLVVGATLLGQPITDINGNIVTLAGPANQVIKASTPRPITPALTYHYSPHLGKDSNGNDKSSPGQVYASQPGKVTVIWKTISPAENGGYETLSETFSVSSNTTKKVRTIFWTEGSFDGPKVQITDGRITTVSPAYYSTVPKAVSKEVSIPGYTPTAPNLTTLSFDKFNGIGQLHAHNVEGRVFIEYLGKVVLPPDVFEQVGNDIVQLVRLPTVSTPTVNLGMQIKPHDQDETLTPSPVVSTQQGSVNYYGTTVRPDGGISYHAERETSPAKDPDDLSPLLIDAYNKVVFYWLESGDFSIKWPKFQNRYWQRWSPELNDYAHYTVDANGSTPETGLSFTGGTLPQIVYQDDPKGLEARMDSATQRLFVNLSDSTDKRNRALIKFNSSGKNWYVNLYTQAETRSTTREVTVDGTNATLTAGSTAGLEVGMVITGTGITGPITIAKITDTTHFTLSGTVSAGGTYTFTVESDGLQSIINAPATVGDRIMRPEGHENAGYISSGTGYYPAGYKNPIALGVPAANLGAIIPVNALPSNNKITVRWFKKFDPVNNELKKPGASFQDLYVEGKVGRYTVSYPAGYPADTTSKKIVIAEGVGTNDLPPWEADGSVYYQNNSAQPGYNPNEEHAFPLGGRVYALREDLNMVSGGSYTSKPFVLVAYTDPIDHRPAMHAYQVLREIDAGNNRIKDPGDILFDYNSVAGTLLVKPYPLPLLPNPLVGTGANRNTKDVEIISADPLPNANSDIVQSDAYKKFTFNDRKGFTWIHRGPHDTGSPTLTIKLYYLAKANAGFFVPGYGEPAVGTVLPFLRDASRTGLPLPITKIDARKDGTGDPDQPLAIIYRPVWPDNPPELRVGETLALPKFGLPQVRGQASAQVLYEQSIAKDTTHSLTKNSVTLHDPTREKTVALDAFFNTRDDLKTVMDAVNTSSYRGKTYFQGLPPHLQQRLYIDPLRDGSASKEVTGSLVFIGTFHDEIAGDDYLDLNLFTAAEAAQVKKLYVSSGNPAGKAAWDNAIDALKTKVETFIPDTAKIGSYKPGSFKDVYAAPGLGTAKPNLTVISDPDTAVDSYAVTATGQGMGFVTMVFGNGRAFTPEGDPVQVKVFKVANQLYVGDLKLVMSSNPLDEQVTLRHSGDFAGKPEDYDFEWRWATGAATKPATYTSSLTTRIGGLGAPGQWYVVGDPGAVKPTAAQSAAAVADPNALRQFPRLMEVHPVTYELNVTTLKVSSTVGLTVGLPVTGPGITAPTNIKSITDGTHLVLSNNIPDATSNLTFGISTVLSATSTTVASTIIDSASYTDAEIAQGYPALFLKSRDGVDFGPGTSPLGVPDRIVFSAKLGSLDGCVLYVNGRAALAYNAPTPQFSLTNSSSGLTPAGETDETLKQFSLAPSFFTPGVNTIEIAIYTTADPNATSDLDFSLEASAETDLVTTGTVWQSADDPPPSKNTNVAIIGGNPTENPFGGPQFVLNDRWFTMRYKPKASANNVLGSSTYSRWMPPQFVEGWVKRVLAAINPFEQRVKDFYNNAVNTDVSLITQAGKRWEGDIALTMGNINDVGLIEIYETVLNRAKNMSINANTNDPDTNNALILAAGYLNDLYTIIGNEAYSDAANPTISLDDQTSVTEVNTSRFSFEGQVKSSLEEELALLRGRDDSVSPGVITAPAYNRLYWNYTHGINGGQVIYAVNYNVKEKVGSSTANGVIDESDAQRMFPQGHGDAYGHYLTALTGYYHLLSNSNFTWTPRAEAVTVLGQPVTVDFMDERKFAAAAGNVARTAEQIVALTYRQSYQDDPAAGWSSFRDSKSVNNETGVKSAQGLDEWVSRSSQGAFLNWAMTNALLPDKDIYHTGVQQIDREHVPEIKQLVTAASSFQTTIDNANSRLNPLGLSPGAIAFDISPSEMMGGKSHFEQVYERSLRSLVNASGAFNQAATMTRSLRDQQNQIDDYTASIEDQEGAFVNELIDIFGRPYSGEIGPGKLYAQGYAGPDLEHWFIVDRPNDLVDTSKAITISINETKGIETFTGNAVADVVKGLDTFTTLTKKTVTVQPSQWVQYNDVWKEGGLGSRAETGELQAALQDAQQSWLAIQQANVDIQKNLADMKHFADLFKNLIQSHKDSLDGLATNQSDVIKLENNIRDLEITAQVTDDLASGVLDFADGVKEAFPKMLGFSNDVTSAGRSAVLIAANLVWVGLKATALGTKADARMQQTKVIVKEQELEYLTQKLGFRQEEVQMAYEFDSVYRDMVTHATELMQLTLSHQSALQQVQNIIAKGNRILADREVFRQRAAAIIQGYRTKDLGFRVFRNEALEQYRSLFDLASRYTYLAAKSYDYETGLLGTDKGHEVFDKIVAARSLGDLTGGVPQSTVSTLGDAGLAGTMAQLDADFSVAKGRLGINNPDQYGTVFSLRSELYRLLDDPEIISDDDAWRQTLEQHIVANVLADSDVATYCRNIKKPDGTPVPGIVISFSSSILHGKNFFGLDLAAGDHAYTPSNYATKIYNVGIALPGYVGMDSYAAGNMGSGTPASTAANALSATPYVYLIPCGSDYMLAPPLGDTNTARFWNVKDQALPLPYNLGGTAFNSNQFFNANGTLSEQPWILRKHQAFRPVSDPSFFYGSVPAEFTNSRLIGRSVWNNSWKIVIPAFTLLNNEQTGLDRFAASVKDIQLFLRTYSHSGN